MTELNRIVSVACSVLFIGWNVESVSGCNEKAVLAALKNVANFGSRDITGTGIGFLSHDAFLLLPKNEKD